MKGERRTGFWLQLASNHWAHILCIQQRTKYCAYQWKQTLYDCICILVVLSVFYFGRCFFCLFCPFILAVVLCLLFWPLFCLSFLSFYFGRCIVSFILAVVLSVFFVLNDSPPPCSVLCHTFQILPSITLYLHLSNRLSPPGISWGLSLVAYAPASCNRRKQAIMVIRENRSAAPQGI
jgi:hypothetical protein